MNVQNLKRVSHSRDYPFANTEHKARPRQSLTEEADPAPYVIIEVLGRRDRADDSSVFGHHPAEPEDASAD